MKDLKPQENPFADWVLSQMTCTMYLSDTLRDSSCDSSNAVLLRFYPDIPEDTPVLKELLVQRVRDIVNDVEDYPRYNIEVDAQQIMVGAVPNLLLKVRNAGEEQLIDPACIV